MSFWFRFPFVLFFVLFFACWANPLVAGLLLSSCFRFFETFEPLVAYKMLLTKKSVYITNEE